jgi:hypothetical protein
MIGHWRMRAVAAVMAVLALSAPAAGESRLALVIGNSNYRSLPALATPANDAKAFADLLTAANFQVFWGVDVAQNDTRRAVRDFTATAAAKGPDTVVLLFFAGYGVQIEGDNFLIPADAVIERESDVAVEALRLADVINALSSVPSKARIVLVDASHGNPFTQFKDTGGRGLAMIDAPAGAMIAFSAAPGTEIRSTAAANSPFMAALMAAAKTPGMSFEEALKLVRVVVYEASGGRQVPWESSLLTTSVALFPGSAPTAAPEPRTKPAGFWRREIQSRSQADAFEFVLGENTIEGYQEFLRLFPQTPFAPQLRALLDRREEMVAWKNAAALNSAAGYQAFLRRYAGSDLAPTARRLLERAPAGPATASSTVPSATMATAAAPTQPGETRKAATAGKETAQPRRKQKRAETRRRVRTTAEKQQATTAPTPAPSPPISLSIGGFRLDSR